jgi:hypothetical protein
MVLPSRDWRGDLDAPQPGISPAAAGFLLARDNERRYVLLVA